MSEDKPDYYDLEQTGGFSIPVTEENSTQSLGEAAVVGVDPSINLETGEQKPVSLEPDTRVEDVSKAESMAYASDEFRTKAAKNRAHTERQHLNYVEINDADDAFKERPVRTSFEGPFKSRARKQWSEDRQRLRDRYDKAEKRKSELSDMDDEMREEAEADAETLGNITQKHGFPDEAILFSSTGREDFYDEKAAAIEEWAGILHEHPVSDAYLASHPGVEITPKSLVQMESQEIVLEKQIKDLEKRTHSKSEEIYGTTYYNAKTLLDDGSRRYGGQPPAQEIFDMVKEADKDKATKWEELLGNLDKIAAELTDFHKELIDEVKIQPLRNQHALIKNLLNDVYTGKASEDGEVAQNES